MYKKSLFNIAKKPRTGETNDAGFTLLEAAIALTMVGLIMVPIIQTYKVDLITESWETTQGTLANSETAINQFYYGDNFEYPCPASVSLGENDPSFGESGDCTLANIKLCIDPAWVGSEGICKTSDTTDAIIIGAVPFSTLLMPQEQALDFWGNKIIYAVTFEQTDDTTFQGNNGRIRVLAVDSSEAIRLRIENGTAPTLADNGTPDEKTDSVDFFLFSTGETAFGGYTKDGVATQPCAIPANGFDHENCDLDDTFFYDKNPNDSDSALATVPGPNFFDDMTRAQISLPEQTWFQHPNHTPYLITMSTRIGIGTAIPRASVEVVGNIRTNGTLQSDQLCDVDGNDCVDPELITGTLPQMRCDPLGTIEGTQAVMQIANSQVHCNSAIYPSHDSSGVPHPDAGDPIAGMTLTVDTSVFTGSTNPDTSRVCPPGQLATGFDSSGKLICVIP